jgi:ATP-binding cassette subfamily B protein
MKRLRVYGILLMAGHCGRLAGLRDPKLNVKTMPNESPTALLSGWRERIHALKNVRPVMKIVWDSGRATVIGQLVSRLCAALTPIAILTVSKMIVDRVVAISEHRGAISRGLWILVGIEFALACAGGVLSRLINYFETLLAEQFTRHVSARVLQHAAQLDLASYEDPSFHDMLERARVQATDRLSMIQATGNMFQQVVLALTFSAGIFVFSPWLLLLLVACVVPAFLGESHFAFLGYSLAFRQTPIRRQLDYLRVLGASKESAKELKLFGLGSFLTNRYKRLFDGVYKDTAALAVKRLRAGAALSLLTSGGYYGAYAYVVYRTATGAMTVGTLYFLVGAIAGASSNIQTIFSTFSGIADQALYTKDLLAFLAVRPKVQSKADALPAPRPIREGFRFENVSFAYPGSPRPVLDRLNFRIEPSERIALIGENGQRKTTIVKLLARLYDPTGGRILLDGIDLREYNIEDLCQEIGVIFQDFMRYDMTAAENIELGKIEGNAGRPAIELAAAKSMAAPVIERLPLGYDQMLGRRFDGGVDLSGGEWQKVALARAYLRDAQVLVLDEPTASLDARSEYEVFQRFAELTEGKMALLISHRFSTVRMADRILVLEGGRIVEEGSHDRLIALGGRYSEMFELQAASYR